MVSLPAVPSRTAQRTSWGRVVILLTLALALTSCKRSESATDYGTALLIRVQVAASLKVDQLSFSATSDGADVFGPETRPAEAGDTLSGTQTVRVLLPDSLAGKMVSVRVDGLRVGMSVATGSAETTVRKGYQVEVAISLTSTVQVCGQDADCNDDNGCTSDFCLQSECHHSAFPNGLQCDDGNPCTSDDLCQSGVCTGTTTDCSAMNVTCIAGVCDTATGVCGPQPQGDGSPCDDGLFCTGGDSCTSGACAGTPRDCADTDTCTTDSCNEADQNCSHLLTPVPGAEGPPGSPTCTDGIDNDCDELIDGLDPNCNTCATAPECEDNNPCTVDTCPDTTCHNDLVTDGDPCDDGQACTTEDACLAGVCRGTTVDCSVLNDACHVASCSEVASGCVAQTKLDGTPCADGQYCTVGDSCHSGVCQSTARDCADVDLCTSDSCNETLDRCDHVTTPTGGGEGTPGSPSCGNGVDDDCDGFIDLADTDCVNCSSGADCDDHNTCTTDTCPASVCVNAPVTNGTGCDDGDACTNPDTCTDGVCGGPGGSAFAWRKSITVGASAVTGGPHTNFPLLVNIASDNDLRTTANGGKVSNANGWDIAFKALDDTTCGGAGNAPCTLSHEVEKWSATTGQLVAWVRVPSLANGAVVWIYYGKACVTTPSANPTDVWTNGFKAVWHLGASLLDSTSNHHDGTNSGTTPLVGAKITDGLTFANTPCGRVSTTSNELKTADAFTVSVWFKTTNTAFGRHLVWEGNHTGDGWSGGANPTQEAHLSFGKQPDGPKQDNFITYFEGDVDEAHGDALQASQPFTDTASWHHAAAVVTNLSTSPAASLYLDGAVVASDTGLLAHVPRDKWDTNLQLGAPGAGNKCYQGSLDEVRVATSARAAGWIRTEYDNQNAPASFYAIGSQQAAP